MDPGIDLDKLIALHVFEVTTDDPSPYSTNIDHAHSILVKFDSEQIDYQAQLEEGKALGLMPAHGICLGALLVRGVSF